MATAEQLRYAHIALSRFGLGAQPRSLQRISADPVGAVLEELDRPERLIIRNEALPTTDEVLRTTHTTFFAEDELMRRELRARVQHQLQTPIGFLERLVLFWSNHFNMTISKNGAIRAAIGHYERQVVRRRLLGSFGELLTATMHHPTMLGYLDNADSMGPNSVEGLRRGSGLNVNLARELLELHTLGVGSGYTEDDVFSLACILTGWSYGRVSEVVEI